MNYLLVTMYGKTRYFCMDDWDVSKYKHRIKANQEAFITVEYVDVYTGSYVEVLLRVDGIDEVIGITSDDIYNVDGENLSQKKRERQQQIQEEVYEEEYYDDGEDEEYYDDGEYDEIVEDQKSKQEDIKRQEEEKKLRLKKQEDTKKEEEEKKRKYQIDLDRYNKIQADKAAREKAEMLAKAAKKLEKYRKKNS